MGSAGSDITQSEFNKTWRVSESLDHLTVWENKDDPSHKLEQYEVQDYDQPSTRELYQLRRNSPYLVNAYSLKKDGLALCQTAHQTTKVFVERIPLRLSNIKDIPFPDVLHLYDTSINGFSQLASIVGFFSVDQDFIGVNDQGQARVWLNTAFESSIVLGSRGISQADMVEEILQLIHNATDQTSFPPNIPNISDYLGVVNSQTTFDSVKQRFFAYVRQYNQSQVPLSLQCVEQAGGALQVNNWCRSNSSFGFEQNSMRLSERFYQSKLNSKLKSQLTNRESQGNASPFQYQSLYFNANPQYRQSYGPAAPQYQTLYVNPSQTQIDSQPLQPVRQVQPPTIVQTAHAPIPISNQRPLNTIQTVIYNPAPQTITTVRSPISSQVSPNPVFYAPAQQQPTIITQTVPVQPILIAEQPTVSLPVSFPVSQSRSTPFSQQPSVVRFDSNLIPQTESRLQQQRVISQAIQIKEGQRNETVVLINQAPIRVPESTIINSSNVQSSSKVERISEPFSEKTYNLQPTFSQNKTTIVTEKPLEDGKSSADFLALLNTLKNPNAKVDITEVYSQVEDTPKSFIKQDSNASSRRNLNYPNLHETYSQDGLSTYGMDSSKRHITSTVSNHFPNALINYEEPEDTAEKYSGQYNFSKYDRAIDPELMADLQRYK